MTYILTGTLAMKNFYPLNFRILICIAICILHFQCQPNRKSPIDYVNPFICTEGDHGHLHPGAYYPFGMVKLGPDTYPSSLTGHGGLAHSGYNYTDEFVRGFSHLRVESSGGTSVFDRSYFLSVLPVVNIPEMQPDNFKLRMDKNQEKASLGIYHVYLSEANIQADLTVTPHAGFHRYVLPLTETAHILVSTGSKDRVYKSKITIEGNQEFSGSLSGRGTQYFYGQFSKPFASSTSWEDTLYPGCKELEGKRIGATFDFEIKDDDPILLKVGFSTVDISQACKNLEAEIPHWDFDKIVKQARKAWEGILNRIVVEGDEEYKEIFYTHLYRSHQQPSNVTDVDGQYMGLDKNVHTAEEYTHYDNYAFWDSFRTKYPLLSLINPEIFQDIARSLVDIYNQSADVWTFPNVEHKPHGGGFVARGRNGFTPFMTVRHEHMMSVVLDAYEKGIRDFDWEQVYRGMRKEMLVQMPEKYNEIGYIPARPDQTCEYCYDNWCVAQMAKNLGKEEEYQKFKKRTNYYKNTWDENLGFFRAKAANGEWLDFPTNPDINREKYMYEGTPWQWRWFVIHDVQGLVDLVGGREKFITDLDYFFSHDLYSHGNQPDLHAAFLFDYVGAPWLTQKWVRTILTEPMTQLYGTHDFFEKPIHDRIYKATPDGFLLEMDDDYGCMAAWYVLSAMGLYQLCPGQPIYQLTAPIFDKVIIKLDQRFYPGDEFIIETKNLNEKNIYIQSATLNGKNYDNPWIIHQDIVKGGRLVFEMGPEPNMNWGSKLEDAPPLSSK